MGLRVGLGCEREEELERAGPGREREQPRVRGEGFLE
jgi:hypothetical protein